MENKLKIENISMEFHEKGTVTPVFKNINLGIKNNEFFCVVGPSGCGKTTMIRIIAGLLEASSGNILIDGKISNKADSNKGVVFQADAVFPWKTVLGNVEFGLKIQGLPKEQRKKIAMQYIELVGLKGYENRLPKTLSGGMKKRVDVARTYAANPEVLLMDEPFGALDAQTKAMMQVDLLDIWQREMKTVFFITHDLDEALFLSDRIAFLTESKPSSIKSLYENPLPRPRTEALKLSDEFQKERREVWKIFHE